MNLSEPWIDARIGQVRAASARSYLQQHGWKPLPMEQPNLLRFEGPNGEEGPVVRVPVLEQGRDYPQRVIELISDLAQAEGRTAVEVLHDVLQHQADAAVGNVLAVPAAVELAPR